MNDLEDNSKNLSLYPNPTTGVLVLEYDKAPTRLEIYSLAGQLLLEELYDGSRKTLTIDLPQMEPGMYILFLKGEDWVVRKEFIQVNN